MNTTPKTDECIKMLGEAQLVFDGYLYDNKGYFDKNNVIAFQSRIKAMLDYRLLPLGVITIPDNADKEAARTNPILQNISDFDAFWYVIKNYQLVVADDLRNEFWGICPDLESIPKFMNVINIKFDKVNYKYDTDIDTIKTQCSGLNELLVAGKLTEKEADEIFWNIHFIANRYNSIMEYISEIYKPFREMAESTQKEQSQQPAANLKDMPHSAFNKDSLLGNLTAKWKRTNENERQLIEDVEDVLKNCNGKVLSALAYLLYNSGAIAQGCKPATFSKWADKFREICGIKYTKYPPNKITKDIECLKKRFHYLESRV